MKVTARKILITTRDGRTEETPATAVLGDGSIFIAASVDLYQENYVIRCWHLSSSLSVLGVTDLPDYGWGGVYSVCVGGNRVVLLHNDETRSVAYSWSVNCSSNKPEIGPSHISSHISYDTPGFTHHLYHKDTDRLFVIGALGDGYYDGGSWNINYNKTAVPMLLVFKGSTAEPLSSEVVRIPRASELDTSVNDADTKLISSIAFGIKVNPNDPTEVSVTHEVIYQYNPSG